MENQQPIFDFFMTLVGVGFWLCEKAYDFTQTDVFDVILGAFAAFGIILFFSNILC